MEKLTGATLNVTMTPAGKSKYETVRDITLAHAERATTGLTDAEKREFERIISVMRTNLETQPLPRRMR